MGTCRTWPKKGTEAYWDKRLRRINSRQRLCSCGCGQMMVVTMDWVKNVGVGKWEWLPKYLRGHMPLMECLCGCGTLIEAFDKRGRKRKADDQSHAARMAPKGPRLHRRVDYKARADDWNLKAAECSCGCGILLHRTEAQMRNSSPSPTFLPGHNCRRSRIQELSPLEESIILGSLVGDMCITKPKETPRLSFTHGIDQLNYARHKMGILERLSWWSRIGQTSGYSSKDGIQGSSSCSSVLDEIFDLTRPGGGRKTVSVEWLDQLDDVSLAYWVMDDGSVAFSPRGQAYTATLHTEGFTESEHDVMLSWFYDRGYKQVVKKLSNKGYWYLYLPSNDANLLVEAIRPHVPLTTGMGYKVGYGKVTAA